MKLEQYIHQLLLKNDCVIVPNFGAFIANLESAQFNPVDYSIHPPNKKIAFNAQLRTNDGLLANTIAVTENCSNEKALHIIKEQVQFWDNRLATEKSLILDPLGKLTYNSVNALEFNFLGRENYLMSSFGLEPVKAKYVLGGKLVEQSQNSSGIWWKAASLIPLIVGGYLYFQTPAPVGKFVNEQWSGFVLPMFKSLNQNKVAEEKTITVDNKLDVATVESEELTLVVVDEPKNFQLIIGAFAVKSEAETMVEGLKLKGFTKATIIQKGKFNLVAVSGYATEEEANEFKRAFASKYPEVWIYKNEVK